VAAAPPTRQPFALDCLSADCHLFSLRAFMTAWGVSVEIAHHAITSPVRKVQAADDDLFSLRPSAVLVQIGIQLWIHFVLLYHFLPSVCQETQLVH